MLAALACAAARAAESARPDALFRDIAAAPAAWRGGWGALAALGPGAGVMPVIRTAWIDAQARALAALDGAFPACVVLGSGFDARPLRMPHVAAHWTAVDGVAGEIPRPEAGYDGHVPRRVPEALDSPLFWAEPGERRPRTLWIAEGIWAYLKPSERAATLEGIDRLSGPGSVLLSDVMAPESLEASAAAHVRATLEGWGEPWKSAGDPRHVTPHGWAWSAFDAVLVGRDVGRWPEDVEAPFRTWFVKGRKK